MERLTVLLPEDLKERAEHSAASMGISLNDLVRDALEARLQNKPAADVDYENDPLLKWEVYDGPTPPDLAARHDDYLYGNDD